MFVLDSSKALSINGSNSVFYNPNQDFYGEDSFTYYCEAGGFQSEEALVTLNVLPVNDAPEFSSNLNYTMEEDNTIEFDLGIFDIDKNKINHLLNFYKIENNEFKKIF